MKDVKWETFELKHERAKELSLEHFLSGVISVKTLGIDGKEHEKTIDLNMRFFGRINRKLNHKYKMIVYKFLGKHHIKIPKCSRSNIRSRGRK